jgi:hypothetical protein
VEELRLSALERRIDLELALGRHAMVLTELEQLVHEHPLREKLRFQLSTSCARLLERPRPPVSYPSTRGPGARQDEHEGLHSWALRKFERLLASTEREHSVLITKATWCWSGGENRCVTS